MTGSPSTEDVTITHELRSRPSLPVEPLTIQHALEQLLGMLDGGSDALLHHLANAVMTIGGGEGQCTAGVCLLESGQDDAQRMRLAATSGSKVLGRNIQLALGQCPCSLCLEQPGAVLLKDPQRQFAEFAPTERPIAELLLVCFGAGTPDAGVLWLAAHGAHRFHQGHADALEHFARHGSHIYHGIRERERLAAQLESRSDQKTNLDRLPIGVAKLDSAYRYTYLNDQAIASLKTTRAHLLGRSVWEAYPEVAGTVVEDAYRSTMEQREVNSIELYFTPVSTWFDVESHPDEDGGIVVFFFDAEERKQRESELATSRESEERNRRFYTTILNNTPDFAYIWGKDYKFLYGNQALLDLYALKEEEYVGRSFRDVGYPEWHARMHEQEIDEVVRTGKPLRGKIPFQGKGGSGIFDYIFMPVFGPDGKVEAIAGTTRDVTALERSAEALKEADKRKDEFLAVLAHELRNPLAPLRNGVELLAHAPEPEMIRRVHAIMSRQVEQMVHLVDDLLDLSRVNRGAIELRRSLVDVRDILETALEVARPLIQERQQQLTVHPIPDGLLVDGDSTRLAQVFSNLLNNAAKYTGTGGKITVEVVRKGGQVRVSVTDTGIGIERKDRSKVFEMFAQVDRSSDKAHGGLGIGLNIVQRLVHMHGGEISVASEGKGKGSSFTVTLPLAKESLAVGSLPAPAKPAIRPLRILIVDDNVDAAFMLSMLLKRMGHDVHATHGGEQALELIEGFKPDVVFLDIGMPDMDGFEVCRRIRRLPGFAKCHIVALTGWGQQEDIDRSRDAGFDHHLVKPTEKEAIVKVLSAFVAAGM